MSGAEAELLCGIIDVMVDDLVMAMEFDGSHQLDVSLFDNLQPLSNC